MYTSSKEIQRNNTKQPWGKTLPGRFLRSNMPMFTFLTSWFFVWVSSSSTISRKMSRLVCLGTGFDTMGGTSWKPQVAWSCQFATITHWFHHWSKLLVVPLHLDANPVELSFPIVRFPPDTSNAFPARLAEPSKSSALVAPYCLDW